MSLTASLLRGNVNDHPQDMFCDSCGSITYDMWTIEASRERDVEVEPDLSALLLCQKCTRDLYLLIRPVLLIDKDKTENMFS